MSEDIKLDDYDSKEKFDTNMSQMVDDVEADPGIVHSVSVPEKVGSSVNVDVKNSSSELSEINIKSLCNSNNTDSESLLSTASVPDNVVSRVNLNVQTSVLEPTQVELESDFNSNKWDSANSGSLLDNDSMSDPTVNTSFNVATVSNSVSEPTTEIDSDTIIPPSPILVNIRSKHNLLK